MYPSYDLVKAIQRDRLDRSLTRYRNKSPETEAETPRSEPEEAEVIELVFGSQCDTGQIGA